LTIPTRSTDELHAAFLQILPRIELHGRCFFRHKKGDKRDEAIAEMVALAWKSFVNCARNGKDPTQWPTALARYAAQAVHNGRRLCGQERIKDVLSPRAQKEHDFTVVSLPEGSSLYGKRSTTLRRAQKEHDFTGDGLRGGSGVRTGKLLRQFRPCRSGNLEGSGLPTPFPVDRGQPSGAVRRSVDPRGSVRRQPIITAAHSSSKSPA
jgi:hypothetical protein